MNRDGFTLIELLVVITIIVVLLALLTPALDKAIYQAELAVCGAKLHSLAAAVQTYAMGSKRRYPHRNVTDPKDDERPPLIAYNGNPFAGGGTVDDRPLFRTFLSINQQLNCPLTQEVDIDGSHNDTVAFSSYALWFGWRYRFPGEEGMYRLGDRFTWTEPNRVVYRFGVLAGDYEHLFADSDNNSHPDRDGVMENTFVQDVPIFGVAGKHTYSFWTTSSLPRGEVDNNFAHDDGSVRRLEAIRSARVTDPRMVVMPATQNGKETTWKTHLPK